MATSSKGGGDEMTNTKQLVTADEEKRISRNIMIWINTYDELPEEIGKINFEQLPAKTHGLAVSVVPGASILQRYLLGGHKAQYQFQVIYRLQPDVSNDKRLQADEFLDTLGEWTQENPPEIDGIIINSIEVTNRAALFATYENGMEDHTITLAITYEVL